MKKFLLVAALVLLGGVYANAKQFMGTDNKGTVYYICEDNAEVAQLLGKEPSEFTLNDFNVGCKKVEKREDNLGVYVVMVTSEAHVVVCYRAEEYDFFFYSWDIEEE